MVNVNAIRREDFRYEYEFDTITVETLEVVAAGSRYKLALETVDPWAYRPDNDLSIILRADRGCNAESVNVPHGMEAHADDLVRALDFLGPETFERFVRIFHGGAVHKITGPALEGTYLSLATDALREYWGTPDTSPSEDLAVSSEWDAVAAGEVYALFLYEWDPETQTWASTDAPHGLVYGDDNVGEEATEVLADQVAENADGMLPGIAGSLLSIGQ